MKWQEENLHRNTFSISMNDLMEIWMETFHPFGTNVVIWDSGTHFDVLQDCGIAVDIKEAYNNKALTVEVPGLLEAYKLMDKIQENDIYPFMQAYSDGKLISDNLGPIY